MFKDVLGVKRMVWLKAYSVSVESVSNWIVIALIVLCVIWVDLLLTIWCLADRKSTKVQTLGELRMRDTANDGPWAGLLAFTRGLPLVARGESDTG